MIWFVVIFSMIFNLEGFGICIYVLIEVVWVCFELVEYWERVIVVVVDWFMLFVFVLE